MNADQIVSASLPIEAVRGEIEEAIRAGPVVVTAPTASGKSTQVPRWFASTGRVLVVEPRRVACRSLAVHVAELEGCDLGEAVGYRVRDDDRAGSRTRIVFATPGVVLRMIADDAARGEALLAGFDTLVLDEFHERRLDVDLILALALHGYEGRLAVMSATMDGERVARHVRGRHVAASGRQYEIVTRYLPAGAMLPDRRGIEDRVLAALDEVRDDEGDVLVFLPGKGEIASTAAAVGARGGREVITLHGGLTLEEQGRAFHESAARRVILSTNVAETSVTLPGIRTVVDSGLVRQTRYHNDRGFLTLVPIASDSADQRAGRAGRLGPGRCLRLWSESARLEPVTPPEVFRESLAPLVLAAAACGVSVGSLAFLDQPQAHAVEAAASDLTALGALDEKGSMTDRGRRVFGLPLDAPLGRLLVEAEGTGCLDDVVDLVSALAVGRPLFRSGRPTDEKDDLRRSGNDALALIQAVRAGDPSRHGLSGFALAEARSNARRLRDAMGMKGRSSASVKVDARRLVMTAVGADRRCVHVARRRKGRVAWSNGGTEVELARESAVNADKVEAVAVLDTHALGLGTRDTRILVTCAMPVPVPWLLEAGLGRERLKGVAIRKGEVMATTETVYAKKVIGSRETRPTGAMAREALRDLFVRGSIFKGALRPTRDRLEAAALLGRLAASGRLKNEQEASGFDGDTTIACATTIEDWVLKRLEDLGVESGADLALLNADDLTAPDLPAGVREVLDRSYPREVSVGDATYRVEYDLAANAAILTMVRGSRTSPPPIAYLPPFKGFKLLMRDRGRLLTLRKS